MTLPEMISLTLQDRIFSSENERLFPGTYLADLQKLKRFLFSKLNGKLRANHLNELKRQFLKEHDITSTYYDSLKNVFDDLRNCSPNDWLDLVRYLRTVYRSLF